MKNLMVWYGNITKMNKEQKKAELRQKYYPRLPISKYFKRIEDTVQLADDARFPWQLEQVLQQNHGQMKKLYIYKDECKDCKKNYYVENKWDRLKTHFKKRTLN